MKPIQDIRPSKRVVRKITVVEEKTEPLDKHSFTLTINQLSPRLNYAKDELSRKERFLRAVHRYNRFMK